MTRRAVEVPELPTVSESEYKRAEAMLWAWGSFMCNGGDHGHQWGWYTSTIEHRLRLGTAKLSDSGSPDHLTRPERDASRMAGHVELVRQVVSGFTFDCQRVLAARYVNGLKRYVDVEREYGIDRKVASALNQDAVSTVALWLRALRQS